MCNSFQKPGWREGASLCATVFNSLGGSSSGPHALVGFRDASCFSTTDTPMCVETWVQWEEAWNLIEDSLMECKLEAVQKYSGEPCH